MRRRPGDSNVLVLFELLQNAKDFGAVAPGQSKGVHQTMVLYAHIALPNLVKDRLSDTRHFSSSGQSGRAIPIPYRIAKKQKTEELSSAMFLVR